MNFSRMDSPGDTLHGLFISLSFRIFSDQKKLIFDLKISPVTLILEQLNHNLNVTMEFKFNPKKSIHVYKLLSALLLLVLVLFGSHNLYGQDLYCNTLSYSIDRGFYEQPFDVELSVDTTGAVIKYTLDGSDPSTSAGAITASAPVTVHIDPDNTTNRYQAPGVCLRAVGYTGGLQITRVKTHTYLFINRVAALSPDGVRPGSQWPLPYNSGWEQYIDYGMDPDVCQDSRYAGKIVPALLDIPSFSIVTRLGNLFDPATGIYMNAFDRGLDWERPASIELLYPDGKNGFQINAGIRIRGGWSRHNDNPKHAFRIFFRGEYGETKLRYPLFGDEGSDEFDKIDLRTSQNYSWAYKGEGDDSGRHNTMLRDVFSRDVQGAMGMPYTRSRYYHLYLNGVYWGLFQTQERPDASYAETYFGGTIEEYDVIKKNPEAGGVEANDGNLDAYFQLWTIASRGFTGDEDYYLVQGLNPDGTPNPAYPVLVDMDNLIYYMICTYYTGDFDAPISAFAGNYSMNNLFAIYNRIRPEGFKYFRHDAEHTLFLEEGGIPYAGIDRTGPYPAGETREQFNPQWLHQQLTNHPEYVLRFADLVYKCFFNDGVLTPDKVIARIQKRRSRIEKAIIAESARWGDSKMTTPRTYDEDWIPAVNFILEDYAPIRTEMVLNQFKNKGWYPDIDPPLIQHTGGVVGRGTAIPITAEQGSIYYTQDGSDPHLPASQGEYNSYTLINRDAQKFALVPQSDIGSDWYSDQSYDISGWQTVTGEPGGIGYETGTGFEGLFSLDVENLMYDPDGSNPSANTGCYVRIPFTIEPGTLSSLKSLSFTSHYDDGIVVYLNGTQILAENVPGEVYWNSMANSPIEPETDERSYNISIHLDRLVSGTNLLAIHALNVSRESSDFLVTALLTGTDKVTTGNINNSAILYTTPVVINEHCKLKARALHNNSWSALSEIELWVAEDIHELRITEIHYHPLDEGDEDNDGEYEFIEIKNMGIGEYNISGYRFSNGIDYLFPDGTVLDGGEILVLASNSNAFKSRYGFRPHGVYTGRLDNSGERIVLEESDGDTLIQLRYNDKYPWPISADGDGYSMVVPNQLPDVNIADGKNWRRSAAVHGSPGADDPVTTIKDPLQNKIITDYQLYQNYPNPFNSTTTIYFQVPTAGRVKIRIFNILGQKVAQLANELYQPGMYRVQWHAQNCASGVYFYHMQSNGFSATKKFLLLK
jgi:hypothetical protein